MEFEDKIKRIFNPLRTRNHSLPPAGSMKKRLIELEKNSGASENVAVDNNTLKLFATASIEMWLRSVHSFLVSAAVTDISPLWASIAGYYSSHYTVRSLAHLLGIYYLRKKRCTVNLLPSSSGFVCNFVSGRTNREHSLYWKTVKQYPRFISNDLFTDNSESDSVEFSDAGHRNYATYIDHLNRFPNFHILNNEETLRRIEFISKMELSSYPIPCKNKYPDLISVQVIAYHRIVFFRELLDEVLGDTNIFWNIHRNPSWCRDIINFQIIKPRVINLVG